MAIATAPPPVPRMPGRLPIAGHAVTWFRNPLKFLRTVATHGDLVRVWLGPKEAYVVSSHEYLNELLVRQAKKFSKGVHYDRARLFLGNGILLSEGEVHRRNRLMLQPAFHHTKIDGYVDIMRDSATQVFDGWHDGQRVGMYGTFYELAIRVVMKAMFSTDMIEEHTAEVARSMPVVISGFEKRAAIPPEILDRLSPKGSREFHGAIARLFAVGHRIVADYRARETASATDDLMTLMLGARDGGDMAMTDQQIHDEFMTMLTAGSDTTSSAMSWVCYLLGRYPEVQERVRAEVDAVVGDRPIVGDDLADLAYTRRVIHEALRLYPPVWGLARKSVEDVEIGGHLIPANTQMLYSMYVIHHDPEVYPDPDRFDPDRWEGERGRRIPRTAFVPFGAGVRNCIGESFAWAEIQTIVGSLLQRWELRPVTDEPVRPITRGALVPGPLPMKVVRRA
jgi:cytochrome P450